jgi:hypothetical protein
MEIMRITVTVFMAVFLPATAHAAESYICEESSAFAVKFENDALEKSPVTAGARYKVVRSERLGTAWEVTLLGENLTVLCENDLGEGGWTRCDGLFTFVFRNKDSFMAIHDVPYTLEVMGKAKDKNYVPNIAAGKCKPL